jgi:hypothetical protein
MMSTQEPVVQDGNAIAGLLAELFGGSEMTTAVRGCGSCGQSHAIGRHRLYHGAGLVLRCPGCGDVALVVVEREARREVQLVGRWSVAAG